MSIPLPPPVVVGVGELLDANSNPIKFTNTNTNITPNIQQQQSTASPNTNGSITTFNPMTMTHPMHHLYQATTTTGGTPTTPSNPSLMSYASPQPPPPPQSSTTGSFNTLPGFVPLPPPSIQPFDTQQLAAAMWFMQQQQQAAAVQQQQSQAPPQVPTHPPSQSPPLTQQQQYLQAQVQAHAQQLQFQQQLAMLQSQMGSSVGPGMFYPGVPWYSPTTSTPVGLTSPAGGLVQSTYPLTAQPPMQTDSQIPSLVPSTSVSVMTTPSGSNRYLSPSMSSSTPTSTHSGHTSRSGSISYTPPQTSGTPSTHPTPLAIQPFIGGHGSVLLVENLDPIPLLTPVAHANSSSLTPGTSSPSSSASTPPSPAKTDGPMVQLSPDHLFMLFGVYGDVVRVKLMYHRRSIHSPLPTGIGHGAGASNNNSNNNHQLSSNPSTVTTPSLSSTTSSDSASFQGYQFGSPSSSSASSGFSPFILGHSHHLSDGGLHGHTNGNGPISPVSPTPVTSTVAPPTTSSAPTTPTPHPSSALIQFMCKEQAALALTHLDGHRVLGPHSSPMKISIANVSNIPFTSARANESGVMTKDYTNHASHRFKYISCKNSRHITAPCVALHLSGLASDVTEDDLRTFFNGVFERTLPPPTNEVIRSINMFDSESKKMAFIQFDSIESAILALVFGHNVKLKGKYMRMTFSHAKEHQHPHPLPSNPSAHVPSTNGHTGVGHSHTHSHSHNQSHHHSHSSNFTSRRLERERNSHSINLTSTTNNPFIHYSPSMYPPAYPLQSTTAPSNDLLLAFQHQLAQLSLLNAAQAQAHQIQSTSNLSFVNSSLPPSCVNGSNSPPTHLSTLHTRHNSFVPPPQSHPPPPPPPASSYPHQLSIDPTNGSYTLSVSPIITGLTQSTHPSQLQFNPLEFAQQNN